MSGCDTNDQSSNVSIGKQTTNKDGSTFDFKDFSHPVYRKISAANGHINRMSKDQILEALAYLKLSQKGTKEVLQKRLKVHFKKQHLKEHDMSNKSSRNYVDYYIVIDFEATCEEPNPPGYFHEIIEFPAVLVKADTHQVISEFHYHCRPVVNPRLSDFCKELTGITQETVDSAPLFSTVLKRFDDWVHQQISPTEKFCIATDGPWDVDRFLKEQCRAVNVQLPYYFQRWVNVRKHFYNYYKIHQVNVEMMLQHLGLTFEGRPHSGIDDSRNIAKILVQLLKDGADMFINDAVR